MIARSSGSLDTKEKNLESGVVLIRSIAEYYKGTKRWAGTIDLSC